MELKMGEYQLPGTISFNFEELKAELEAKVSVYSTMVYTDDQIKIAKADKAALNKLKKALNDERIRRQSEYMVPFEVFKKQIDEIISIIDKPVGVIDKRVKEFEQQKRQEKLDEITKFFNESEHPVWLHLSQIMDERWMNASVSMKSVQDAIDARLDQIEIDLTTLHDLPEFGFEATEVYISTLDINRALNEGRSMSEVQKKKAEHEAEIEKLKAEAEFAKGGVVSDTVTAEVVAGEKVVPVTKIPVEAPERQWIAFQALLSTEDALALKEFFNSRNIKFNAI